MRREGRTEIHRGDKATQARKRQETGPPSLEAQLGQRLHEARLCKQATSSPQACSKEGLVLVNPEQAPLTRSRPAHMEHAPLTPAHTELALHQDKNQPRQHRGTSHTFGPC